MLDESNPLLGERRYQFVALFMEKPENVPVADARGLAVRLDAIAINAPDPLPRERDLVNVLELRGEHLGLARAHQAVRAHRLPIPVRFAPAGSPAIAKSLRFFVI